MAIEELAKSATRSTGPTPNPQEDVNPFLDVLASPFRGVEGAIQGIYDLADYATGDDLLPDYNERFLGRSQTFVGGLGEGITQFLTGFIPVAGVAGRVGALTKVGKAGKKALNLKGYAAAGAVADFGVFQAQEQRLSNLIQAFPSLANPVNEYLAADDSDGEIEGRFKNTIEGLGIGGITDSLFTGIKALKRKRGGEADEEILKDLKFDRYRDQELLREDFETTDDFRGLIDQAFTKSFGKGVVEDGTEVTAFEAAKQFNSVYEGEFKPLLEALLENGEESLGNVSLSFSKRGDDGDFTKGTTFKPDEGRIDMQEGGARTFVHELMHATTSAKLDSDFKSVAKQLGTEVKSGAIATRVLGANKDFLETIARQKDTNPIAGIADAYLQVVKSLEADDAVFGRTDKDVINAELDSMTAYGLTNIDEFIAESFTNPEFRRVLMEIPSTNEASKTMFDQFMDAIKKMLGVNGNQATLLDDVFKYTDSIVRDQDAMFDGSFDYLKSVDDLGNRMNQRELSRTLDERGDDFKTPEGERAPVSEMQGDVATPMRGKTMGKFKYPVKGDFFGKDLSEIPTPILKKAMTYNNKALSGGVKNRIQAELNAIEGGYAPYVPFEDVGRADVTVSKKSLEKAESSVTRFTEALKDEGLTDAKKKQLTTKLQDAEINLALVKEQLKAGDTPKVKGDKAIPPARPYGEVEGTAPYKDADSYLKAVNQGGVTPKEAYARYLRNRGGVGGKAENNSMRLQEYIENQQILRMEKERPSEGVRLAESTKSFDKDLIEIAARQDAENVPSELGSKGYDEEYKKRIKHYEKNGVKRGTVFVPDEDKYFGSLVPRGGDLKASSTGKNPRIQGKSQRSSDLERAKGKGMPDSITEARERGRAFSSEFSSTMGQRKIDELKTIQKLKGDLTELIVNGDVGEDFGPDAMFRPDDARTFDPDAPKVEGEKGKDYGNYVKLKEKISQLEEDYASKYGDSSPTMGQRQLDQNIEESIARMANDLETGGDGAIANFARGIRDTTQAVALVQAIAKNLEKAPTAKTVSAEELIAENADVIDILGGNAGDYADTISRITETTDLSNYRNVQSAVYKLMDVMTADVVDLANQAKEARVNPKLNKQQLEVQLLSSLDQMQEVGRLWSLMGREAGLTLVQRKFLLNPNGKYRTKSGIGFDSKTAQPKDYDKYVNENRAGTMPVDKMVDVLAGSKDKAQAQKNIKKTRDLAEQTFGSKAMDITMEVWMNSLLSGPTTQVVNVLGNSLTLAIRTIEQSVGAVLTGNPQLAKASLKYAFDMESFVDVLKIAGQTFKSGESRLVQGSKAFDDRMDTSKAIAKDGGGTLAKAINILGTGVRIPSRALSMGDEFFKQMNYRSYVKTNLAYEAMKKGAKSGEEVAEYVTKNFDNFITKGARAYNEKGIYMDAVEAAKAQGLKFGVEQEEFIAQYLKDNPFDETRGGLADAAKGYAEETTFTNDLENEGVIGTLSNTLNTLKNKGGAWRTLNFVIPFLRTPTNILKFSIDRTPLGTIGMVATKAKRAELTKQLMSEDPVVRAQIRGKLAVSTAASASILYYMNTNKGMITGGGPPNRDELESLRLSGWRPYSLKIGDTYYSYQRADPIATVLGLFADIIEGQQYHDVEDIISQDMVALGIMSLTQNVTNKSYVKGLDTMLQLVRDPVGNFKPFAGNIVGGFAPTFFTQIQNMADERELKETRSIFDYWLKKMPIAQNTLPSRRNFLGEVITNKNSPYMTGVLNPIYFNKESSDPVDKELAGLQHGFSQPSTKLYNALEMRDVYNKDGRQAFDRYLELSGTTKIGGKTMRESLRTMVKDKGYQSLANESNDDIGELSPRIKAVQRLVRAYRRKGRYEMLEEFPELQASISQLQQDKAQYRAIQ